MFFNKAEPSWLFSPVSEIEKAQIDLINSNRAYAVIAMAVGAVLLYLSLLEQVDIVLNTSWLVAILSVDLFRLLSAFAYRNKLHKNDADYESAKHILLIGTILSGAAWGSTGLILLPHADDVGIIIITIISGAMATGSTTTLSYQYRYTVIFVALVTIPLMMGIAKSSYFEGLDLLFMEIMISVFLLFLIKNTMVFYKKVNALLKLQMEFSARERELHLEREKADQANRAKSAFLANMSHELRTPMHAILGFSDLGKNKIGGSDHDKMATYFTRINDSGQRLLALLNDLLDLSKLEAGRMSFSFGEHDLQDTINIVAEEFTPLFSERSLTVDVEPTQTNTRLVYDSEKIIQVIRNLLSNAIKYTPDGMSVMIYFEDTVLPPPGNNPDAEPLPAIAVSILDQGTGIPESELKSVFEKFVQSSSTGTGAGGTGLGLAISRDIIRQHGGTIIAKNNKGGGSVFTFTLPRSLMVTPES